MKNDIQILLYYKCYNHVLGKRTKNWLLQYFAAMGGQTCIMLNFYYNNIEIINKFGIIFLTVNL